MKGNTTKVIIFEGIDCAGKGTQILKLQNYFDKKNKKTLVMREPGGTEIGEDLRTIIKTKDMNSMTEFLLFSAARSEFCELLLQEIESNKYDYIILDRFHFSSMAYQGYGRGLNIDFLNHICWQLVKPIFYYLSNVFYLKIDLDTMEERKQIRSDVKIDRIEKSGNEFYQNVIEGFDYMFEQEHANGPVNVINAKQNSGNVHIDIIKNIYI